MVGARCRLQFWGAMPVLMDEENSVFSPRMWLTGRLVVFVPGIVPRAPSGGSWMWDWESGIQSMVGGSSQLKLVLHPRRGLVAVGKPARGGEDGSSCKSGGFFVDIRFVFPSSPIAVY